jgi:MerR family transcriptional regulator, light-induced transcriptional regulator
MHPLYQEFVDRLDRHDKDQCVRMVLSNLKAGTLDIISLYDRIILPAQQAATNSSSSSPIDVWEEHVRTSIIRTVVECCYPCVLREREARYHSPQRGRVLVVCPPGELHEIGARIVADYFTLCGFAVDFIGANTPQPDILEAIRATLPRYVAISITNFFNLVVTREAVEKIVGLKDHLAFQVILGGRACQENLPACRRMHPDRIMNSFEEIHRLAEEPPDVLP